MDKSEFKILNNFITEEMDSKLLMLTEFLIAQSLPGEPQDDLDEKPELLEKTEPTTPITCSLLGNLENLGESAEGNIRVNFPDIKPVYLKIQSRANRLSRQRVESGKIKIRVVSLGPQVLTIEAYVERTPDAAMLFGDRCGRVRLKPQPGKYYPPNQQYFTVDLDSIYESPTNQGVPVYKLSTVDSERRNKFRLVVVVVLIGDVRSSEFISRPFRLRSRTGRSFRSLSV